MLKSGQTYAEMRRDFQWGIPARLNMAQKCLAYPSERIAILDLERGEISYGALEAMSAALAQEMRVRGVEQGDRIGVLRSQDAWTAAAHLAIWSLGAISVPLFTLFQREALDARTLDAGLSLIITDDGNAKRDMTAPSLVSFLCLAFVPSRQWAMPWQSCWADLSRLARCFWCGFRFRPCS